MVFFEGNKTLLGHPDGYFIERDGNNRKASLGSAIRKLGRITKRSQLEEIKELSESKVERKSKRPGPSHNFKLDVYPSGYKKSKFFEQEQSKKRLHDSNSSILVEMDMNSESERFHSDQK